MITAETVEIFINGLKYSKTKPTYHHLKEKEYVSDLGLRFGRGITFLEGGTGVGKTRTALTYKDKTKHINLSVPLTAVLINKAEAGVELYWNEGLKGYAEGLVGTTTAGTYDSVTGMSDMTLEETIIFYDEFTYASMSQGFRDRIAPQYKRMLEKAWATILMSGTVYSDAVLPFVDDYHIITKDGAQKRECRIIANKKEMGKLGFMESNIIKAVNDDELLVVFVESKEDVKALKNKLKQHIPEEHIMSIVSGESTHTVFNSDEASEAIKSGRIPKHIRVLIWTSVAIVGADLRHDQGNIPIKVFFHSNYNAQPEAIAQMCGRFRDVKMVECFIGCSVEWYKKHFKNKKIYNHEKTMDYLGVLLMRGVNHYKRHGTFEEYDYKHLFFEEDMEFNILGIMEWITQQIKNSSDWTELYRNFEIEIMETRNISRKVPEHMRYSFIDAENSVLTMSDAINYDAIDEALEHKDTSKIENLPQEIQMLIRMSHAVGVNAGKRIEDLVSVRNIYTDPYTWRMENTVVNEDSGEKRPPALSTMKEKAKTAVGKWNIDKMLRKKLLTVLGNSEWYSKEKLIDTIKKLKSGRGHPFAKADEKKELLTRLRKPKARITTTLSFLNLNTKRVVEKDGEITLYRLELGARWAGTYQTEWLAKNYEPFYKDDGMMAQYDVVINEFDELKSF